MVRVCPVLPNVNRLPRTQAEIAGHDRHEKTRVCHGRTKMCRHIVEAFFVVLVVRAFWSELSDPPIEVPKYGRISVFLNDQACRRVLHEDGAHAHAYVTVRDDAAHEVCHVVQASPTRTNIKELLMHVGTRHDVARPFDYGVRDRG